MPTAKFQPSFAAGVLGPGLHGRIDTAKYDVGLKEGYNVFVHAHGGVSNRAGTEFICEVMDSDKKHRLIPFKRDGDQHYVMLMGDEEMKIIFEGGMVQSGSADYNPSTPFTSEQIEALSYVQSVDVMFFAHPGHYPKEMERASATSWTFSDLVIDPDVTAPTISAVTPRAEGGYTYKYKVAAIKNGVEGFPSSAFTRTLCQYLPETEARNTIEWNDTGADEYYVYRERNNVYGYIGYTDRTSFRDDYIDADLTTTPVEASDFFGSAGNYPARAILYQQRLIFGASNKQPETLWMSRTGDYRNFTSSRTLKATDSIELDISGEELNAIRGMLQLQELLIFTSAGEFSLSGPDGVMDATQPIQTQYGYSGSIALKPLVVDDTALFVDRTGRNVRDLRYTYESDNYTGNDLSVWAPHFFEGKQIKDWAYAKNPFSIVWVVLDDGTLLSFTYKREHQVWAWCEHDLGGDVESIASVTEGAFDAVYMIVKRTINGDTRRYVERLHERSFTDDTPEDCYFVDCGLTYEGAAVTEVSGLDHLEGEEVVALADGNVIAGLTVSGGTVSLGRSAETVHVGLPYYAEFETLPPALDLQDVGSSRGRPHKITKAYFQMEKTRGIKAWAADTEESTEYIQASGDLALQIPLTTGMDSIDLKPSWNKAGTITVRQDYPLPMTILGISPEISVGRS
ncbi:hypothetical protein [uncultured Cohaesibacter sp.]|uniref:phage nozzle protein n=1 Tax=uncultured Cohaesibacter sp. TaxID=1002546 RepID=UPI0029307890|nr:hypothetical protein [uncultured Cohaesibacter sp.]